VALPVAAGAERGHFAAKPLCTAGCSAGLLRGTQRYELVYEAGLSEVIIFLMFLYSWVPM
jgi:hypothetical protein